jgi:ribosomal protein L12E/L44/L45/RPP1/RPP2
LAGCNAAHDCSAAALSGPKAPKSGAGRPEAQQEEEEEEEEEDLDNSSSNALLQP